MKQANALFAIELDGKTTLAITKDVQRDVVKNIIEHVDLLIVTKGEKVSVDVPVTVVGESYPGTIHVVETQTLSLEAEATHLPSRGRGLDRGPRRRRHRHRRRDHAARGLHAASPTRTSTVVAISVPHASADDVAADEAAADLAASQSAASAAAGLSLALGG